MIQHLTFVSVHTCFLAERGTVEETEGRKGTETGNEAAMMKQEVQETICTACASHCSCP